MDKKHLALAILIVCVLSLVLGLFSTNTQQEKQLQHNRIFLQNIELTGDRIALINIEGTISSDISLNSWSNTFTADAFLTAVEKAQKDNKVKAVIIRINSPGGTVAASQDIYDAILRLRKEKPVVASLADVAASGGYYAASAADRIVAQKGTMTGSIGVIFNFVDIAELSKKIGISSNIIKSGRYKDAGSLYRKMTPEEKEIFKNSVYQAYGQFVDAIDFARVQRSDNYPVEKRILDIEILEKYADGRVFLGEDAYDLGFVDMLGSQHDAQILASQMAGYKTPLPLVSYNKMNGWEALLTNFENKIAQPISNFLPFSYMHTSIPLMIWE